eukprot:364270-Chlamydomonas_euryale.AAC.6
MCGKPAVPWQPPPSRASGDGLYAFALDGSALRWFGQRLATVLVPKLRRFVAPHAMVVASDLRRLCDMVM